MVTQAAMTEESFSVLTSLVYGIYQFLSSLKSLCKRSMWQGRSHFVQNDFLCRSFQILL